MKPRNRLKPRELVKRYKREKDPDVKDRMLLNLLVERNGMPITKAARTLGRVPSWGAKWRSRYLEEGVMGLQTRPRSGRPPKVPKEIMREIKEKAIETVYITAEGLLGLIQKASNVRYAVPYARALLRDWGFTRKVPVGRHVRRANRWKIA